MIRSVITATSLLAASTLFGGEDSGAGFQKFQIEFLNNNITLIQLNAADMDLLEQAAKNKESVYSEDLQRNILPDATYVDEDTNLRVVSTVSSGILFTEIAE